MTIRHSDSLNADYYLSIEYQKKKKAKFEEINGNTLDINITEEEYNYLIERSKTS